MMLREIRLYIQSGSCVLGHWPQKTTSLCKSAMKQLKIEESIRYVVVDRLNSYQYPIGIRLSLFLMLCVSQSQLVLPTTYANRFHPTNQPSFVGKNVFWFHFSCHKVKVSDGIAPTLFPPSISSSILLLPQMHTEHQLGGGGEYGKGRQNDKDSQLFKSVWSQRNINSVNYLFAYLLTILICFRM